MKLHLFRHGQTDWNAERRVQGQSESRLNELGIQQATALGERIRDLRFDRVFCSSSVRTRETAAHAFAHGGYEIDYLDSLREIHMGPWEGLLYDDISARDPDSFHHFWHEPHLFRVEGAETFYDLQERALTAIAGIAEQCRGQEVAVVSHGALIKSILCHVDQRPMEALWTPPSMHNCAHSIIEYDTSGQGRIAQYADQPFPIAPGRSQP